MDCMLSTQGIGIEKRLTKTTMSSTNAISRGTFIHEENNSMFICKIENVENESKGTCVLNYQILDKKENCYEFYHIEVSLQFRGPNLARSFATNVFQYAFDNVWKVDVTCTCLKNKFLQGKTKYRFVSILL